MVPCCHQATTVTKLRQALGSSPRFKAASDAVRQNAAEES